MRGKPHNMIKYGEKLVTEYGAAATLVSLVKLRQFCSHPLLLDQTFGIQFNNFSKFERLKELLGEIFALGEKALVFTSYTKMADLIAQFTSRNSGTMTATLDGRLNIVDRQPLIDKFF